EKRVRSERQGEGAVRPEIMPAVADLKGVVATPVHRSRKGARVAEQLAPRIGRLEVHARGGPQCDLRLQRVIIGVAWVRLYRRGGELRVRFDEVFRETGIPQYRPIDPDGNVRQVGVDSCGLAVVQRIQTIRQSLIVPIREIVLKLTCRCGPKMLRSGLRNSVEDSAHRPKSGAGDVDTLKHLV